MSRRVLVFGGRNPNRYGYSQRDVWYALYRLHHASPITCIVHGGCKGADRMAAGWAAEVGVPVEEHPALWGAHGPKAGPLRNEEMAGASLAGAVGFPGGRGTADMARRLKAHGVPLWLPLSPPETNRDRSPRS